MGVIMLVEIRNGAVEIDAADLELISQFSWRARSCGKHGKTKYAEAQPGGRSLYMHRLILDAQRGQVVDHINLNGLDNRRANLRLCTVSQNVANSRKQVGTYSSEFKGVSWHRRSGKWRVCVGCAGQDRSRHVGYFTDEIEAAHAYDAAARSEFGVFARLNFQDALQLPDRAG